MLSILIPTYNRGVELERNLQLLCTYINSNNLSREVEIIICDNASKDETESMVIGIINENLSVIIKFYRNDMNRGLEYNVLRVAELSQNKYIMYLGDDDYISEQYLMKVIDILRNDKDITSIISSYKNILPNGKELDRGRDVGKPSRKYKKGFRNCFINSWRGHQLSGLVFKTEGLLSEYRKNKVSNLYPFIYFLTLSSLNGSIYHLTEYPVLVTRPHQSKKDWSYGDDGLISHVFNNYRNINKLSLIQRSLLELKFLDSQYWRYAMYIKLGVKKFLKCISNIIKSENTSIPTKILFPILLPFILLKQSITLIFCGKLFNTLKTKVEI